MFSSGRFAGLLFFVCCAWSATVVGAEPRIPPRPEISINGLRQLTERIFDENTDKSPWRCIEIPGFLVASRGPQADLVEQALHLRRAAAKFAPILPPPGWHSGPGYVVPVILYRDEGARGADGKLTSFGGFGYFEPTVMAINTWENPLRGNVRVVDAETGAVAPFRDRVQWRGPVQCVRTYYQHALQARQPPLPHWLTFGNIMLFGRLVPSQDDELVFRHVEFHGGVGDGFMASNRAPPVRNPWMQLEIPMREILLTVRHSDLRMKGDPVRQDHVMRQIALFAHWSLVVGDEKRRYAYWAFAADAARQAPTEAMFRQHFAMSFADLDVALSDVLIDAGGVIPAARIALPPLTERTAELNVRPANEGEIEGLHRTLLEMLAQARKPNWYSGM